MNPTARYAEILRSKVIPAPRHLTLLSEDAMASISEETRIILETRVPEAKALILHAFADWWNVVPQMETRPLESPLNPEGYTLKINAAEIRLCAESEAGVRNALWTLRQLAEAERGTRTVSRWNLPLVDVEDYPETAFRCLHLCWFPETPAFEIERSLRMAAFCKFNYVILESWGMTRLHSHPEYCWDEFAVEPETITALVELGRSLGVTVIPQFNLFGHATLSRTGTGKHVLLDSHPEYESLFEPDGWSWCLSNPETRKYLTEIVQELIQIYQNPPFFHIGCDEAYNCGSCSVCEKDLHGYMLKHIQYFHDLLASQGIRAMMWHDMLLAQDDTTWRGYTACGYLFDNTLDLVNELPKDIILCDWEYGSPLEKDADKPWPTVRFFREKGFDVMPCPWNNEKGIWSLGDLVHELQLPGIVVTTWHQCHDSQNFTKFFWVGAQAAWHPTYRQLYGLNVVPREYINRMVRLVNRDAGAKTYRQFGTAQHQIPPLSIQEIG